MYSRKVLTGSVIAMFAAFMVLVPLAGAAVSYLYERFFVEVAIATAAVYFLGALVFAVAGEEH